MQKAADLKESFKKGRIIYVTTNIFNVLESKLKNYNTSNQDEGENMYLSE